MPPNELERLGVSAYQFGANVALAKRFMVAPEHLEAYNEIKLLPRKVSAFPIRHVHFGTGTTLGVLDARTVHPFTWVE